YMGKTGRKISALQDWLDYSPRGAVGNGGPGCVRPLSFHHPRFTTLWLVNRSTTNHNDTKTRRRNFLVPACLRGHRLWSLASPLCFVSTTLPGRASTTTSP